jgi:tetratricopeptide (TPR) repeat protein
MLGRMSAAAAILLAFSDPTPLSAQDREDNSAVVRAALESAAQNISKGDPRAALESLNAVDDLEPNNPWLWYYRGSAHQGLGNWYEAMAGFDKAGDLLVSYGNPEPKLLDSIRDARHRARKQVFGMSLTTGLDYDSNVSFLGDGGAGLDLIAGRGDGSFASTFRLAYAPVADDTESLVLGLRLADKWHYVIKEFDEQDYGASVSYSRKLSDRWRFDVRYAYDITYLGREPFLSNHSLSPGLTYTWPGSDAGFKPYQSTIVYSIDARDFLFATDPDFDRDGFANRVSVRQSFTLHPGEGKPWLLDAGYSFESVATEGTEFDRLVHTFQLGVDVPLKSPFLPEKALTLALSGEWQIANYREHSLIDSDNDRRQDFITTLQAALSQEISSDPELGDVVLNTIVGWTNADSNVTVRPRSQPFSYEKWVVGIQLDWSW